VEMPKVRTVLGQNGVIQLREDFSVLLVVANNEV
jgi:hypothetical protein